MSLKNHKTQLKSRTKSAYYNRICFAFLSLLITTILTSSCSKEPDAGFDISSDVAAIGATVTFTNTSSDASYYQWDFGDGSYAITENPTHAYTEAGTYNVTLKAIGKNKSSSVTKQITVTGDISIFPGTGITEVSIGDTWSSLYAKYETALDTTHDISYDSDYKDYEHIIYFYDIGFGVVIYNDNDSTVSNDDQISSVFVTYTSLDSAYYGYTAKGIHIGSTYTQLTSSYGTADYTYTDGNYKGYYYTSGVVFWVYSSTIIEIDIYESYNSSKTPTSKTKIKSFDYKNSKLNRLYKN